MIWCYGLVQEKQKLVLSEVYVDAKTKKPWGYCHVKLPINKADRTIIAQDLKAQLETNKIWKQKDFKIKKSTQKTIPLPTVLQTLDDFKKGKIKKVR